MRLELKHQGTTMQLRLALDDGSSHADVAGDTGYALEYGRCTDDAAAGAVFEPPCSCNGIIGECCCSKYAQVSPRIIAPFIR